MSKKTLHRLWRDERGEVTYAGIILVYTLLALGSIVGLVCLRNQIVQELGDLAIAFDQLDQSYSVDFASDCPDYSFEDSPDLGPYDFTPPNEGDPVGQPPADIDISVPPPVTNTPGEQAP
jgi:hypothetical protein